MDNVQTMRPSQIKDVLRDMVDYPGKMPALYIWGGPGIGKSAVVKQVAEEKGINCIDIRLSLLDPTDLRGIPVPENGIAKWLPPSFLPTEGRGIIFLDELNCAPPLVTASALQLVLDRKLGEYVLPSGYIIVAAGNRELEAFVRRLSPPLLNRFLHVYYQVDMDEWVAYAMSHDFDSRIVAFISKFRPELLYQFSDKENSFPTPRSWEFLSNIYSNGLAQEIKELLTPGCVGMAASIEVNAYMKIWSRLPDLDKILSGETNTFPTEIDLRYACCVGLVTRAKEQKDYDRLMEYGMKFASDCREYLVFLIKLMFSKDKEKVIASPNWKKFADTNLGVIL